MQIFKNPLSSWLVAIAVFVMLPLAQYINGGLLSAGTKAENTTTSNVKNHALLITGSGLHCALKNGRDINHQTNTHIKSVYLPLASIWSFQDIERTLEKSKPDLIVLQGSLLANNSQPSRARIWLRQLKQYWLGGFSRIHPLLEKTLVNLQCQLESLEHEKWNDWLDLGTNAKSLHEENIPQQAEFLKKLVDSKKPIVIVNQPHPSIAQTYSNIVIESVDHIIEVSEANDSVTRINYTSVHPDNLFFDPYHPKPELSTIFTHWFHGELNRLIEP